MSRELCLVKDLRCFVSRGCDLRDYDPDVDEFGMAWGFCNQVENDMMMTHATGYFDDGDH